MSEPDLFTRPDVDGGDPAAHDASSLQEKRRARTQRAALWAAYGDALGWISELTDSAGLRRRTGGTTLTEPVAWKRRIGGRSGVNASLPLGCYSDDTQLRLATSRAIRSDAFDVEAFAKVELPVWLSYGLGGGKSTNAAAAHLALPSSTWWRNRFKGWTQSGGNGAAMRIQPHVWASRTPEHPESYLLDVVRNAVCTHSHPTGLLGAVLHAQCVARALVSGKVGMHTVLEDAIGVAGRLPEMIGGDRELTFWRVAYEEAAGDFGEAWATALSEARDAVSMAAACDGGTGEERYQTIVDGLKLRDPARRGSGMLTAVAAAALAWCEPRAAEAMCIAANTLGTDTDTIGSMAGAILGATVDTDPPVDVLDVALIRTDAERLGALASGGDPVNHQYPDLMAWQPPKSRADALASSNEGELVVRGLGRAHELKQEQNLAAHGFRWRWVSLDFGQTLLIKGRECLPVSADAHRPLALTPRRERPTHAPSRSSPAGPAQDQPRRADNTVPDRGHDDRLEPPEPHDIQKVVAYVREHIQDDKAIGRALRRVVRKGTAGDIAGFSAALVDLLRDEARRIENQVQKG